MPLRIGVKTHLVARLAGAGLVLVALIAGACAPRTDTGAPLALRSESAGDATRLLLIPATGWKINALLAPALETGRGVIRFHGTRLTADSAYFAEPPSATVPGPRRVVSGILRASVCAPAERVCRGVTLAVSSGR